MIYETLHRTANRSKQQHKVVIVDWDDTILPSTFIDRWQIENSKDLPLHVSLNDGVAIDVVFLFRITFLISIFLFYSFKTCWQNLPIVPINFY
jgi:hypothetical protein